MKWEAVLFPSVEDVIAIHECVLDADGGYPGTRSMESLEGAVMAPQATFAGRPLLTTMADIAASFLFYLVTSHPFLDGNKRTALATSVSFLDINGFEIDLDEAWESWVDMTASVATGDADRDAVAQEFETALGSPVELTWR